MPLLNENVAVGLPESNNFQVGRSGVNPGAVIEKGVLLPWPKNPLVSWVYYDCTVGVMLDSGIAVHNRLPQVNNAPDTLSMCDLNNPRLNAIATGGVNLKCNNQYTDIMQRMGHARYWFRLWGQALRIGKQVPIPGIRNHRRRAGHPLRPQPAVGIQSDRTGG